MVLEAKWRSLLNGTKESVHIKNDSFNKQTIDSRLTLNRDTITSYAIFSENWAPYYFNVNSHNYVGNFSFNWNPFTHSEYQGVDFQATPFTNTLAIRSLNLDVGKSSRLPVMYVTYPEIQINSALQIYTRIELNKYRFEQPVDMFMAEFYVDDDGLVKDYPGWFERIA